MMVEKERWKVDTKVNYKSVTRLGRCVAKRVIFLYVNLFPGHSISMSGFLSLASGEVFFMITSDEKNFFTSGVPLDETHLVVVRGLIHQEVSPKCVNEESSTERGSNNRQVNRSPQL